LLKLLIRVRKVLHSVCQTDRMMRDCCKTLLLLHLNFATLECRYFAAF